MTSLEKLFEKVLAEYENSAGGLIGEHADSSSEEKRRLAAVRRKANKWRREFQNLVRGELGVARNEGYLRRGVGI